MKYLLCIHLPQFALQRLLLRQPELERAPVVFVADGPRGGRRVVDVSSAAARHGVRLGAPAPEAEARLGRRLRSFPYDLRGERRALQTLADRLTCFSPLVGLAEEDAASPLLPESLLLDATGVPPLFGGRGPFLEQVAAQLQAWRLQTHLAAAATSGAALALARFAPPAARRPIDVPREETAAALAPLPVAALRLPEATLDLLGEFALATIGDLLRLPRDGLAARFGPELSRRLDQALGFAPDPWQPFLAEQSLRAELSLETPLRSGEALHALLDRLCRQLADALAAKSLGALAATYSLRLDDGAACEGVLRFHRPATKASRLLELWTLQLEHARLAAPVAGGVLEATQTVPLVARQRSLFPDPDEAASPAALSHLIERLSIRLGEAAVARVLLTPDAQPEFAYRTLPAVAASRSPSRRSRGAAVDRRVVGRPLLLLPRPIPVAATLDAAGLPIALELAGRRYEVAACGEPERIETGWWRRRIARDYHRIETTAGARFWLYRTHRSNEWKLHGEFG